MSGGCIDIIRKLEKNPVSCVIANTAKGAVTSGLFGGMVGLVGSKILGYSKTAATVGLVGNAVFGAGRSFIQSGYEHCYKKNNEIATPNAPQKEPLLEQKPSKLAIAKNLAKESVITTSFSTLGGMMGHAILGTTELTLAESATAMAVGTGAVLGGIAVIALAIYLTWNWQVACASKCVDVVDNCCDSLQSVCESDDIENPRSAPGSRR